MTKLLEQEIAQIREVPEEQQDVVATKLINLIDDRLNEDEQRELTEISFWRPSQCCPAPQSSQKDLNRSGDSSV